MIYFKSPSQKVNRNLMYFVVAMALPVMEFQDQGYKIRKIFALKSTNPKEIIEF